MSIFENYQKQLKAKDFYKFSHDVYTYMMFRVKLIQRPPDDMLTQDPLIQKCIEPIGKAVLVLTLVSRTDAPDDFITQYVDFNDDDFILFVMDIINYALVNCVYAHTLDILSTTFALIKKCSNKSELDLFHVGATCFTDMMSPIEEIFLAKGGWNSLLKAAAPYEEAYNDFLGSSIWKEIDEIKLMEFIRLKVKDRTELQYMIDIAQLIGVDRMDVEFFDIIVPALKGYVEYREKEDSEDKYVSAEKNPVYRKKLCEQCWEKKQGEEMEFLTQKLQSITSEVSVWKPR